MFWEYYLELGVVPETVVLVGDGIVPQKSKGRIQIYPDFEEFQQKLEYILLSAYRKGKKAETFSSTLANAILILSQIRLCPGVTTSQLDMQVIIHRGTHQIGGCATDINEFYAK